jgi:hypothetical protein
MTGHRQRGHRRRRPRRLPRHRRRRRCAPEEAREDHEARARWPRRHPRRGAGNRADRRGARPVPHLLRARPRPHPPRHRVPAPGRQDPGLRLPRRPPAHPAHPRPRGGPGRPSIARAAGLNVALTEAIALGHDCGHGPGGHASEDALAPTSTAATTTPPGGPTSCTPRSTSAPRPSTASATTRGRRPARHPRGRGGVWADRIAYVCHDFEDAVAAGIVTTRHAPGRRGRALRHRPAQPARDVRARDGVGITATGRIGMDPRPCRGPRRIPAFNYEHVYLRPPASSRPQRWCRCCAPSSSTTPIVRTSFLARRSLRRSVDERRPGHRRRWSRGASGGRRVRGRDDRPVRLPAGPGPTGMGSGQAASGYRRLRPRSLTTHDRTCERCVRTEIHRPDPQPHDEEAAEAVQQIHLVLHERAAPIAVQDPDGHDATEPVEGVELRRVPVRTDRA